MAQLDFQLVSTAEDLARFGIALLEGKLLKPQTLDLMWKPALGGGFCSIRKRAGGTSAHRAKSYVHRNGRQVEFQYSDLTYKFASGGMVSTAEDLARFGIGLLEGKLLKPQTLNLMWKPALGGEVLQYSESSPLHKRSFEQGLVWRLRKDERGRRIAFHCGSVEGFGACLVIYPDAGLLVAHMTNGPDSAGYPDSEALAGIFLESQREASRTSGLAWVKRNRCTCEAHRFPFSRPCER